MGSAYHYHSQSASVTHLLAWRTGPHAHTHTLHTIGSGADTRHTATGRITGSGLLDARITAHKIPPATRLPDVSRTLLQRHLDRPRRGGVRRRLHGELHLRGRPVAAAARAAPHTTGHARGAARRGGVPPPLANGLYSRRQRREQVRPVCRPCLVHLSSTSRPHLEQVRPAASRPRFFSVGRCGPPRGPPSLLGTQS